MALHAMMPSKAVAQPLSLRLLHPSIGQRRGKKEAAATALSGGSRGQALVARATECLFVCTESFPVHVRCGFAAADLIKWSSDSLLLARCVLQLPL